jgi:hypothetical protein
MTPVTLSVKVMVYVKDVALLGEESEDEKI